MRIAMFTNTYAPLVGGIEKSVQTFAEDLRDLSHEVLIVTLQQDDTDRCEPGILRLPAMQRVVSGQYAFKFPGESGINDALDAFEPDVIHAHQPFMLGNSAFRQAVRRNVPLVFTNHTLYERYADQTFLGDFAALERAAAKLAIVYANLCEAVIAPTASIAAILQSQGVAPGIDVVPTGIDTRKFAAGDGAAFRRSHGIPADAFVAGHLGRLIPAKRVDFLAEAVAGFLTKIPRARALFCGEGQSAGGISEIFQRSSVSDRLTMLGNLLPDEIADAYSAMDVFAFASVTDTQGIVLLEAMAAGAPVLAIRATGPQDLVENGISGRLLDSDSSPGDFAAALQELAMRPDLSTLSCAARLRAVEFDRRDCAALLLGVYEKAIRLRARRTAFGDPPDSALESFQRRVEAEWRLLAGRAEIIRALLPTRGFPGIPD